MITNKLRKINIIRSKYSKYQYKVIAERFDRKFYIENHPEVKAASSKSKLFDPVLHYMQHGVSAGYDPHPDFSTNYYLKYNKDVAEADQNPFFHYIVYGHAEGRLSNSNIGQGVVTDLSKKIFNNHVPEHVIEFQDNIYETVKKEFDIEFYKNENPDIKEHSKNNPGFDCVQHYIEIGFGEGRNPSRDFCSTHYLEVNSDVRVAGINPLYHFITAGRSEGRTACHIPKRRMPSLNVAPKVLFIGHSGNVAGAEIMLNDIIEWYANKTSYNIDILVLGYGPLCQAYQKFGRVVSIDGAKDIDFLEKSFLASSRYDYIYCNSVASSFVAPSLAKLFGRRSVPLIMHVHEMRDEIAKHETAFKQIAPQITHYIAASERVKSDLCQYQKVNADDIAVYESFITISAQSVSDISSSRARARAELGISEDEFVILGSGTVYDRKGPDVFTKAIEKVAKSTKSARVVGVWIGEGPDLHGLRHWIWQNGNEDFIRFVGFKKNARELIAAADLFFLSSREDPFPLVCLEAAQYAIPVIYFAGRSGISSFVGSDAGMSIEHYDDQAAATALTYLLSNPPLRAEMGLVARARVLQRNSQNVVMPKVFEFLKRKFDLNPTLSIIVPNYNHEKFIGERLQSVFAQDFYDMELLVLDDASTDKSMAVIEYYRNDNRVSVFANKVGSGSPFSQWKKGISLARGALIWVAESDDSCSPNFIESVLPGFTRNGLSISHCRTINIDEYGNQNISSLKVYLSEVAGDKFDRDYFNSGYEEVESCMAVACTVVNASGAIMRKVTLEKAIGLSDTFVMCGDWIVYLAMLSEGAIAYTVAASNYFRRHTGSVVSKLEGTDLYFKERSEIAKYIAANFQVSSRTVNRMVINIEQEWRRFDHINKTVSLRDVLTPLHVRSAVTSSRNTRRSIGFYIHGLMFSKGGIEKQGVAIANHFSRQGHQVTIFCRRHTSKTPVYEVDDCVNIVSIFDENDVRASGYALRRAVVNHGVELFIVMLSEWLFEPVVSAVDGLSLKVIASEHNDPWVIEKQWWSNSGRQETFERVDCVHLLLDEYISSVPYLSSERIRIIPNGAEEPSSKSVASTTTQRRIISVGRFVKQKNFPALIKGFARSVAGNEDWQLHIFGEGPDKTDLEALILDEGLKGRVLLRGLSDNIYGEMALADFIVIPSLFEGFPLVAVEAKMSGLPIIAYESCNGMKEIVRNGVDGLLCKVDPVSDTEARHLAELMFRLMSDEKMVRNFKDRCREVSGKYSLQKVLAQWDDLVADIFA